MLELTEKTRLLVKTPTQTMTTCLDQIKLDQNISIEEKEYLNESLPEPFCFNPKKIKAFVLGADPSNFSDGGKPQFLTTVFGIGYDHRYFSGILKNLNAVGLHLEDVYVQNVVRNYMIKETGSNKTWKLFAEHWLPDLKEELDLIDKSKKMPVLVTAESILKFLVKKGVKVEKADTIYSNPVSPIPAENSKLGRPLIAFYRHPKYSLTTNYIYQTSLYQFIKSPIKSN